MSPATIRESRQIMLPLQTVIDAVLQFDARRQGAPVRGPVVQADLVSDAAGSGLQIAVMTPDDHIEWRRFDRDELAAAIIQFCRTKRIPLPYRGAKSLTITKDGAAFQIENEVNVGRGARVDADIAGRPLQYARGYEPFALMPASRDEVAV